jgi:DNA-binding XRE family transcriptional regulator
MDPKKEAILKAAGHWVGDSADWLGLSDEERELVDFQATLIAEIRRRRVALGMSQVELAERIGSSQSRVAKIEAGSPGVSTDMMLRAFFALGGRAEDLSAQAPRTPRPVRPVGPEKFGTIAPKAKSAGKAKVG